MKRTKFRRETLAKRLEQWARLLRAGKPIRVGGRMAHVPARVVLETEFESKNGEAELEIEIKWPTGK